MAIESGILIDVLLRLFASGVTALPLHDSVIVARSKEAPAREAMLAAHSTYATSRAKLHVYKSSDDNFLMAYACPIEH